jgi:hypothetical protein
MRSNGAGDDEEEPIDTKLFESREDRSVQFFCYLTSDTALHRSANSYKSAEASVYLLI